MPKPTSKNPQRIQRMLAMHAEGASAREIAEELGVGHTTINNWLAEAGLPANGGQGPRGRRKRVAPGGLHAAQAETQRRLAELESPTPSTDIAGMLTELHEQLAEQHAFVRFYREGAKAGTATMAELDKAQIIAERLATKIAQLTPQASADPEKDPANLEAAAEVRQRFAALVEAAERSKAEGVQR
jgi:predicted transcriptional regulator